MLATTSGTDSQPSTGKLLIIAAMKVAIHAVITASNTQTQRNGNIYRHLREPVLTSSRLTYVGNTVDRSWSP